MILFNANCIRYQNENQKSVVVGMSNSSGLFSFLPDSVMSEGDVLKSPDNSYHFVLVIQKEYFRGNVQYLEVNMQKANQQAKLERFIAEPKNNFGRAVNPAPDLIEKEIPIYIEGTGAGKYKALIPARHEVKQHDRLTVLNTATVLMVTSAFRDIHPNIDYLQLQEDNR